jgi:hypothetical protein
VYRDASGDPNRASRGTHQHQRRATVSNVEVGPIPSPDPRREKVSAMVPKGRRELDRGPERRSKLNHQTKNGPEQPTKAL